jgi:hypothetical protein
MRCLPLVLLAACSTSPSDKSSGAADAESEPSDTAAADAGPRGERPEAAPPPAALKRLSASQYAHAMRDLFGEGLVLPSLEPDLRVEGLYAVGSARTALSSYGVEKYETGAYSIAAQVLDSDELRDAFVPCDDGAFDEACARAALDDLGRRAWRRRLSDAELDALVEVSALAASALEGHDAGLEFGIAALLTSPHFLYRVELGDASEDGRYSGEELASRLAFFLWDTIPDEALLDAAEAGELDTDEGLEAQVDRMLADPKARDGVRRLYTDMLHLDELDGLTKDPAIFTYMRDTLGASARTETLLGIETLVFEDDGSYLDLYTSQRTFLNRELAALYDVPAPAREGFGEAWLEPEGGRRGFFGQVSFLATNAHVVSTSATQRGIFVREVVLCQTIPEPPADANTAIPEADADAPTMRERIAVHLEVDECASCHRLTDPIGLGFENFDGLGLWRVSENGATIDPSGELDGVSFSDSWGLAAAVADHPATPGCMVRTALQSATGALVDELEPDLVDWHAHGFGDADHRILWLLRDLMLSPAFTHATPPEVAR